MAIFHGNTLVDGDLFVEGVIRANSSNINSGSVPIFDGLQKTNTLIKVTDASSNTIGTSGLYIDSSHKEDGVDLVITDDLSDNSNRKIYLANSTLKLDTSSMTWKFS